MVVLLLALNNFSDLLNVVVGGWFGYDYTLFAFACLLLLAGAGYLFRLPFILNLGVAWCLVYMFDMLGGGTSYLLQAILVLLSIGLAVSIIRGLLGYAKDWSQ